MITTLYVLAFIFGLSIGSFVNAFEYRIRENKSISGRSFCPHCKHQLAWYDLFPLFSYVFLRGKCRYCGKKISPQYPIVELLAGISFLGVFWRLGLPVDMRTLFSMFILFFVLFVTLLVGLHDYKTTYILSGWVYGGVLAAVARLAINYTGLVSWQPLATYLAPYVLSALVPGLIFYSLYFFSKGRWMGEGEYELAILMGLALGFPLIVPAYYFAFIAGSVLGLMLVYVSKQKHMNSEIPFGPFLMGGLAFALIFGQQIADFYARIFLG